MKTIFNENNIKHMYFYPDQKNKCSKRLAVVEMKSGTVYIRSYNTVVARIDRNKKLHRLWNGFSVTTLKHVNLICDRYGIDTLSKKEWLEMPIEKPIFRLEKWLDNNVGYWTFNWMNDYCTKFIKA